MAALKKKVLIVEDNAAQSVMMKRAVEKLGHEVIAVVDQGRKAMVNVTKLSPDLILMDIFLNGDMTGIETMRKIREQSDVPVIYITANPDPHYRGQAKRTDFSDYLYKPVKFSELRNAVKNVLGKNEKRNGVMKSVLKRIGLAF